MPILSRQIAQRVKGALGEDEDWWRLCYDTEADGFYNEHKGSYVNPYKFRVPNTGTRRHPIANWDGPGSDRLNEAKAALTEEAKAART